MVFHMTIYLDYVAAGGRPTPTPTTPTTTEMEIDPNVQCVCCIHHHVTIIGTVTTTTINQVEQGGAPESRHHTKREKGKAENESNTMKSEKN